LATQISGEDYQKVGTSSEKAEFSVTGSGYEKGSPAVTGLMCFQNCSACEWYSQSKSFNFFFISAAQIYKPAHHFLVLRFSKGKDYFYLIISIGIFSSSPTALYPFFKVN
jgi:hypothetical protein